MYVPIWILIAVAVWALFIAISSNASSNAPLTTEQQREDDGMYLRYGITPPRWSSPPLATPSKPFSLKLDKVATKKIAKFIGIGAIAAVSVASLVLYIGLVKYWW